MPIYGGPNITLAAAEAYTDTETSRAQAAEATKQGIYHYRSVSANTTALAWDFIKVDASVGNVTVTIPVTAGAEVVVERIDSSANSVTVVCSGTIDGDPSASLVDLNTTAVFLGDGTNVSVISAYPNENPVISATSPVVYTPSTRTVSLDPAAVTVTTQSPLDNSTKAASTAYADAAVAVEKSRAQGVEATLPTTYSPLLNPTATKTSAYSAAVNDLVMCDATSGNFAVALPSAPSDKSVIGIKKIDGTANQATLTCAGTDTFSVGGTTLAMVLQGHGATVQYQASAGKWIVISNDLPYASTSPLVTQYLTAQAATPYVIPPGAKTLTIRCSGGGGGGGSGARMGTGVLATGGGSGSSGITYVYDIPVAELTALGVTTLYVTNGAGGTGGAAVLSDTNNGNTGSDGVGSYVATTSGVPTLANCLAEAAAGHGGAGGNSSGAAAGGAGIAATSTTGGIASSATGAAGLNGGATAGNGHGGAGSGGGITTGNAQSAGGTGGYINGKYTVGAAGGPAGGASPGANAGAPVVGNTQGAGGGGSSLASAAGAGGNGLYGSGGGGGGASRNGFNSGAGGKGGDGFVEIIAYF